MCRVAGCVRAGDYARELCESHYKGIRKLVEDKVISWERLERQGKVAATRPTLKEWALS
jgi:hypothetical protein